MRFKYILMLALLLYNAGQYCWATAAAEHDQKPPAVSADKNAGDDGGNGNKSSNVGDDNVATYINNDGLNIYEGKFGGQQTAAPAATSTKHQHHKQKHGSQTISAPVPVPASKQTPSPSPAASSASIATYVTKSTTSTKRSTSARTGTPTEVTSTGTTKTTSKTHTKPAVVKAAPPLAVARTTSQNNHQQTAISTTASMQPAFAYKAVVPTHEERLNTVEAGTAAASAVANSATNTYNDDDGTENKDTERNDGSSKKIIGSSVVTSVSVILNGNEPEFTDALGHKVPKPLPSLQVASPIDLLNPDRYEFYTFDDNGELVKRLMTLQEIQSIVANGDGEGPAIIHTAPIDERDPEKNVQDIVNSVQTVLSTHVESNKNSSTESLPVLDTPDVSSSWSMILPAIFGNTGGDIFPPQKPQQIVMIPDSDILEASTKMPATVQTSKKPKPNKRKPGQKRKTSTTTTTEMTPQIVQEELAPHESVYTGMEQYQSIASNVPNFEGLEALNLKPLIPTISSTPETTTRRVFVNNQEIIQTASTTTTTEQPVLDENFAKRPYIVPHNKRPLLPHRNKTPNDDTTHSTKRPQVTHTKQKIKKKPTITSTTTTTMLPLAETKPTTTTTPPPLPSINPTIAPKPTTQKKKKKKPTRQPATQHPAHITIAHDEQSTHHTTKPRPHGEERPVTHHPAHITTAHDEQSTHHITKPHPHAEKQPVTHHPTHITTAHDEQSTHHTTKPRPHGEKRPVTHHPAHITTAHDEQSTHHTTKPHPHGEKRPVPHHPTHITTAHYEQSAHHTTKPHPHGDKRPETHHPTHITAHDEQSPHHTTKPRPHGEKHKPTHKPTTVHQKPRPTHTTNQHNKHTTSIAHDQSSQSSVHHITSNKINHHKRPRPHRTTTTTTESPPLSTAVIATPANDELIVASYPGLPTPDSIHSAFILGHVKNEVQTTSTTIKPVAYPVPVYDIHKPTILIDEAVTETKLEKQPLPSLSMVHQQEHQQQEQAPSANEDLNTMMSFDQLMQSLKGDENKPQQDISAAFKPPVKYDSAESIDKLEEMAEKKKKPMLTSTTETTTAATVNPLTEHYGGSTLATMLAGEEDGLTGRPFIADSSTESVSTEKTTMTPSDEQNTPVVLITQRPIYFATTRKPEDTKTTATFVSNTEETQTETPDVPSYTLPFEKTEKPASGDMPNYIQGITRQPDAEQANVVKFEPLYAEDREPIVTEITTPVMPHYETTIFSHTETEETTNQKLADEPGTNINASNPTESTKSEAIYTTQAFYRLPVSVPQKVDEMIAEDGDSTEKSPNIVDLKPHLNLGILKPTDQILMGEFQTQAATVASTLVDGTNKIATDSFMSSNETKDEIQFLMSDVLQQMSNQDQYKLVAPEPMANRLTSFAQLNSSFLMKPSKVATKNDAHNNYGQATVTVATTEKISRPQNNDQYEATELPLAYEKTTIIPSREELIKIEADYLNTMSSSQIQMGDTETPISEEESTTFRIPLLSVSQMYAQQQEQQHKMDAVFEYESDQTTENILQNTEIAEETTAQNFHQTAAPVSAMEINEYKHDENQTIKEEQKIESSTHSPVNLMTSSEEKLSSELSASLEDKNYGIVINASEPQPEHLENNFNYQNTQNHTNLSQEPNKITDAAVSEENVTDFATMMNEPVKTPMNSLEKQSIEHNYATMINEPIEAQQPLVEAMLQTLDYQKPTENILNDLKEQIAEVNSSEGYSILQDQTETTTALPAEEITTLASNFKNENVYDTESSEASSAQRESNSVEESTERRMESYATLISETTTVESQTTLEQTTSAYTMNTQTSEELLGELLASMYNQTGSLETPEDVYIKLGETTAKPVESLKPEELPMYDVQHAEQAQKTEKLAENSNETTNKYELPAPIESHESQLQHQVTNLNKPVLPILPFNYSQISQEDSDDEDETDQTGYQQVSFVSSSSTTTATSRKTTTTTAKPTVQSTTKRLNTLKPVSYYKQPSFSLYNQNAEPPKVATYTVSAPQQRPVQRPAALSNLMATSTQATRPPVKLEPSPEFSQGLEASVANLDEDVLSFARLCNELAFSYWKSITSEKISSARSMILSPFALTSMLSMVFLGARGGTSGEMNEVLKLDDMVTFNPHLIFKNITDSVEKSMDSDIATAAFVREIFSDRNNGKILQFFKEKTQQFYAGHVEEVNFHVVNDIIRRRTNLLIKRHTMGKVLEYLRTNSVWVNGPLATISANLFQTDCSQASTHDRDGEMFFQVHPTVRQRRLVPIPAVLYKSGFTAGYEPKLDATVVAFGRIQDTVSTIYVMPGHQSSISPTDNLERLQNELIELAFTQNAWSSVLTSLMDRPGMEVQLPRFSHRSFVNASLGLQKMGLKGLFQSDFADLRGLTGSSNRDIYLSDMIQINTFSTCGEERISDHHHVEMYPAPPLRKRNKDVDARDDDEYDSSEAIIDFGSLVQDATLGRGFYDDLLDPKYLELPLPLRPRQARVPDTPRLRFDKPFLYFVRHNPTGMILFMGRFNPRLLP